MALLAQMQKWTPATVLALLIVAVFAFAMVWYIIHFQEPPTWLLTAIGVLGGGGLFGAGATAGVNSTQDTATAAAQTAAQTVTAAHLASFQAARDLGVTHAS